MRKIRRDVVMRYWGSETELTREAYRLVNEGVTGEVKVPFMDSSSERVFGSI